MATKTIGAKTQQTKQVSDPARLAAQQEWAKEQLGGEADKVVILPVFKKQGKNWVATEEFVHEHANGKTGYVIAMGAPSGNTTNLRWLAANSHNTSGNLVTAIVPGSLEWLNTMEAGNILSGRLDTYYTTQPSNAANLDQDVHYTSATARELGVAAKDAQGNVIYSYRFLQEDLSAPKPTPIAVANMKEINEAIAAFNGQTK